MDGGEDPLVEEKIEEGAQLGRSLQRCCGEDRQDLFRKNKGSPLPEEDFKWAVV